MALIDDTEHLVDGLFRNGSTNNERLQELLWQLKMISELSDEELKLPNDVDIKTFFVGFLTNLANRYRPTNASKFPEKLLTFERPLEDIRMRLYESTENFAQKIPLLVSEESNCGLALEYVDAIRKSCNEAILVAHDEVDRWLVEINY